MIDFIRNLFTVNHELIYFIYGLMFFVLGLAIALQSRHSSRHNLARSLNWLAAWKRGKARLHRLGGSRQ